MPELRQDPLDTFLSPENDPQALSEAQLRQLYDEEEVERFISLFSAYVTEVRLSTGTASTEPTDSHLVDSLDAATGRRTSAPPLPRRPTDRSLSERIAYNYLLPHLPPSTIVTPTFTLKRLGLTIQRLYLALFPPYQAFLLDLAHLAVWKDYQRSLRHCITFWLLWFYNLLLPALVFRIVFGLLRRRLSAFPSLKELQDRRRDTARALKFGEAVQQQLSVTTLGPIEMWRLFKLYKSEEKVTSVRSTGTYDEENFKRDMLFALNELADFHERVKNIFTWRRRDVSRRYLLLLIVVGFGTLVLPAQYIAKLVYWFGGMLFWHVTPVIAALPRADRTRVSLLLRDAPTDTDYAMELIARRIATGQDVGIASLRNQSRRASSASASTDSLTPHEVQSSEDDSINWKKWGERVARGKLFVEGGRRFLSTQTSRNQISGETVSIYRSGTEDAHTFLAQYASSPGLITLTSSTLFFTSLARTQARLAMPRDRLRGVRKCGLMKGISITWAPEELMEAEEREERFHWQPGVAMFFSPDLLSKRDSGFGLLWLAATLGSKSAFKKLPKRSVMTADISQLCRLIATPAEPLALRLSSNLLVGAARTGVNNWAVKQDIFMSDVTTCFNSLKRVEHELRSMTSSEGQLQMAQPSVKSSAVTLRADPRAALSMEFDAMVINWDEYLNLGGDKVVEDDSDNDYHPTSVKTKGKAATSSTLPQNSELLRATACTLPENHDFLLANSFDASFGGSGTMRLSSSQTGGFGFDDTFDGMDIGEGVGDDLVRELGEGWGASPIEENAARSVIETRLEEPFGMDFDNGDLDDGMALFDGLDQVAQIPQTHFLIDSIQDPHIESVEYPLSPSLAGTTKSIDFQAVAHASRSPPVELAIQHAYEGLIRPENNGATLRKTKRARLMLDVRTELTDEELKATRMYYLNKQNNIRCGLEFKRFEKRQADLIHSLLWDAPGCVHAKELIDFWVDRFKVHVEARSGLFVEPQRLDGTPRQKRRKVAISPSKPHIRDQENVSMLPAENWRADQEASAPMGGGDMFDFNYDIDANWRDVDDYTPDAKKLRSSEEPGQARRASHPPPAFGDNLGVDVVSDTFHSQRSALFPWDMAGSSSSISAREGGIQQLTSDRMSVEHADARLRGSSASRRGSSLPSLPGNLQAGVGSPAVMLPMIQSDDDFIFDVPGDNLVPESRQSEANRVALEKNSYNFLEYAKMQYMSLPSTQYLVFDDVVPTATSTARVAAAALYHCLVLATKDLLQVNQEEPYGRIDIRI
ncbi:hypothetical protein J3R82DRAFT_776 [Butyriboletus roseoflavus]|nr:hypothetical protein J3R82DRAFT_776 [Butyriboletus roseoflavus]